MIDLRKFYAVQGILSASPAPVSLSSANSEAYGLLIDACVKCSAAFKNQYQLQVLLHTTELSSDDLAEWAVRILDSDKEAVVALGKAFDAVKEVD